MPRPNIPSKAENFKIKIKINLSTEQRTSAFCLLKNLLKIA